MRITNNPFTPVSPYANRLGTVGSYHGKEWGVEGAPASSVSVPAGLNAFAGRRRLPVLIGIMAVVMSIFFGRLAQLQLVQGVSLRTAAEENRIRLKVVKASRGIFYDRHGEQLVQNVPDFAIYLVPADLPAAPELHAVAQTLATLLREDTGALFDELAQRRQRSFQEEVFREHVPYNQALKIRLIERSLPGMHVVATASRSYIAGPAFSHLLGYNGKLTKEEFATLKQKGYQFNDQIGKEGLERSYESLVKGVDGQQQVEVNSLGKEHRVVAAQEPVAGTNVFLSIDAGLQKKAQEVLDAMVEKTHAPGGALVALDPRNGHVLAMVSAPTYDNNAFIGGIEQKSYNELVSDPRKPLFQRALAAQYPPGSTIKPFIASLALQEGVITEHTTVQSTGGIRIGQWFFPDWKGGGHGTTDLRKAIAESVNTFFYMVGGGIEKFSGLGVTRIARGLARFGFGSESGIDVPGEASGFLPTVEWKERIKKEPWYIGDTYHLAIGQGDILVTPLQMAVATGAIANGGTLYQPTLLYGTSPIPTSPAEQQAVVRAQHIIDARHLRVVREGMRDTVLYGSARAAQSLPVAIAGKTGTAQFGPEKKTNAWFTAFAPYESPEIAITVVIEAGGEGHAAALPVASDVLRWQYSR